MAKVNLELLQYIQKDLRQDTVKLHSEALVGVLCPFLEFPTKIFVACVQVRC